MAQLLPRPNESLEVFDRARALSWIALARFSGRGPIGSLDRVLAARVAEERAERERTIGSSPCLLVTFTGPANVDTGKSVRSDGEVRFGVDLLDKEALRTAHRDTLAGIAAGVSLIPGHDVTVRKLGDVVYLVDSDGTPTFSLSLKVLPVRMTVAKPMSLANMGIVKSLVSTLAKESVLGRVPRLMLESWQSSGDRLREFLAIWNSLEILVAKLFRMYQEEFIASGENAAPAFARKLAQSYRDPNREGFTLGEKFIAVAACLQPADGPKDLEAFMTCKEQRDLLLHGQDVDENHLPSQTVEALAKRYLWAHAKRVAA